MQFYADEDFPLGTVEELRRIGHDVLTAHDDGRANRKISDQEVLERAHELDRAPFTHNRGDFKRLHLQGLVHSGVLSATQDPNNPVALATRIDVAVIAALPACPAARWHLSVYRNGQWNLRQA
jgi:hypothetical protein